MKPYFVRALPLAALSALVLSPVARAQDTDGDFLSDSEEQLLGTSPYNTDTDGDNILDRAEVYPYQVIAGSFTFEQAVADAASKGGWLAIIDSPQKLYQIKRGLLTSPLTPPFPNVWDPVVTIPTGGLWIGAHDKVTSGLFQWVDPKFNSLTPLQGAAIGSAGFGDLTPRSFTSTSAWTVGSAVPNNYLVKNVVDIKAFKLGSPFVASGIPYGAKITAINTTTRTLTLDKPVDAVLSRRVGQIVVTSGGQDYTEQPTITFTDLTRGLASVTIPSTNGVYASPPTLTFTGGGATTQAAITATLDGTGRINGYVFTNRGTGYTSLPTAGAWSPLATSGTAPVPVADLGTYPTAEATYSGGRITEIHLTSDGTAWLNAAPTITISNGNGAGATATTNLTAAATGVLSTVSVVSGGTGYTTPPAVAFVGGGGSGAVATATVVGGVVRSISIVNPGKDYSSPPIVTFTGVGSGASANATIRQASGRVESPLLLAYTNWPLDTFPGNRAGTYEGVYLKAGTDFAWSTAQSTAEVLSVAVTPSIGNTGYSSPPKVSFVGGGGSGATGTATVDTATGKVTGIIINSSGSGYTSTPRVILSGGLGLAPTGVVKSIDVNSMGSAVYNSPPTINITGGGGVGASAVATLNSAGNLLSITMTSYGYGYTSAPTVTLDNGAVTTSTAILPTVVANYGAASALAPFVILNKGTGYVQPPTVDISGGGGSGAEAIAAINGDGTLASITLINAGTNYSSYPTVTISGGGGRGATAVIGIGSNAQATATLSAPVSVTTRGYVLERPVTGPLLADTDGDGLSDNDEFSIYGSNPTLADTDGDGLNDSGQGWVSSTIVVAPVNPLKPYPYDNALVYGDYEGLVMETARGMAFKQTLRLTNKGAFTGSTLRGFDADTAFSGAFTNGSYDATDKGIFSEVHMSMIHQGGNTFYIQGSYVATTGETFTFELRPARTFPTANNLTFSASLNPLDLDSAINGGTPTGAVVATGSVAKTGWVTFNVYLPDGGRSSYAGPMVDGKLAMLYARNTSETVLAGPLVFSPVSGQSDFNGTVRLFNTGNLGGFFSGGFDQTRSVRGSNFVAPSAGKLPLGSFTATNNNVVYQWSLGNFYGIKKVGTWSTSGVINIPRAELDNAVTSYNGSTGLIAVSYTRTDTTRSLEMLRDVATGYAVVSQVSNTSQGFYVNGYSCGQFSIVPNTLKWAPDNYVPPSISPLSFQTRAAGTTYTVIVTATSKWALSIPASATWVRAQNPISSALNPVAGENRLTGPNQFTWIPDNDRDYIADADEDANFVQHSNPNNTILHTDKTKADTDGDGIIDGIELLNGTDPTEFDGKGNGKVVITLAKNTTNARRTAIITIAGVKHTITQEFR